MCQPKTKDENRKLHIHRRTAPSLPSDSQMRYLLIYLKFPFPWNLWTSAQTSCCELPHGRDMKQFTWIVVLYNRTFHMSNSTVMRDKRLTLREREEEWWAVRKNQSRILVDFSGITYLLGQKSFIIGNNEEDEYLSVTHIQTLEVCFVCRNVQHTRSRL